MTNDLSRHVHARPDGHGGVILTPRFRFRDVMGTYIDPKDNVARSREVDDGILSGLVRATTSGINAGNRVAAEAQQDDELPTRIVKDANGNSTTEQTLFVFGPTPGQSYKFNELNNGTVAVVLVSPASDLDGTVPQGASGTADARSRYLTGTLRGEARALANMNSANKRYYGR